MSNIEHLEIRNYLPHRYPFLLVDRVLEFDVDAGTITAIKNVTANEPHFNGHFPHNPVMPGVLIIEALAQAACFLGMQSVSEEQVQNTIFYLAGIDNARFKRQVVPGDCLTLQVLEARVRKNLYKFNCQATVDGQIACSAQILAMQVGK
jgi:3-hydroxyacyl-[acyl-carrier-protein] dehydratase